MANLIKFSKGLTANLPAQSEENRLYFTLDGSIYIGVANGGYHEYSYYHSVASAAALPSEKADGIFYAKLENAMYVWGTKEDSTEGWVQVNPDHNTTYELSTGTTNGTVKFAGSDGTEVEVPVKGLGSAAYTDATAYATAQQATDLDTAVKAAQAKAEEGVVAAGVADGKAVKAQEDVDALSDKVGDTTTLAEGETVIGEIGEIKETLSTLTGGDGGSIADSITAKINELDVEDAEVAGQFVVAVPETDGKVSVERRVLKAEDIPELAQSKVTGLVDDLKAVNDAIDAVETSIGTVPEGKDVVTMIADAKSEAITAATYDDTKVKEDIKKNADAITLLNNNAETQGSVDYKIAQAVAAIMENPDETMNSINELVTWVNGHAEDALKLSNQVETNKGDIADLKELVGDTAVATQIANAIAEALKVEGADKYALASDLTAAIARITVNEAAIAKLGTLANKSVVEKSDLAEDVQASLGKADSALQAADIADIESAIDGLGALATKDEVTEDVVGADLMAKINASAEGNHSHSNKAELDKIAEGDKAKWDEAYAKMHEHANKAELDLIESGDKAKWDASEQNAKDYADGLNEAMDERVQAVEGTSHTHANIAELNKIVEGDKAKWDAAEGNAKAYADTQDEATLATAKSYAETQASNAQTAAQNFATEADAKVLSDAVTAATTADEQVLANAKAYSEDLITWETF